MGESACLRRSLSHPSAAFRHSPEGDPIRCLTESVSFGRFVSESLDWERWSAFSHNRYLEEVQQISKAGSVAEKKAFFEAHYKRRAAMNGAGKLERANVEAGSDPEPSTSSATCTVSLGSSQTMETVKVVVPDAEIDHPADVKCVLNVSRSGRVESHETGVVGSVNVEPCFLLEDQMQVQNTEAQNDLEQGTSGKTCRVSLADSQSVETVNVMVPDAEMGHSADVKCVLDIDESDCVKGHETGVVGSVSVDPSVHLEDQMQVGMVEAGSNPEPGTSGRTCSVSLASLQSVETVNVMVPDAEIDHSIDVICVLDSGQSNRVEGHESDAAGNISSEPYVNSEDQMQVGLAESSLMKKVAAPEERTDKEVKSKRQMSAPRITSTNKAPKLPRASIKRETFSSTKAGSPFSGSVYGALISQKNSASKTVHMSISFSSCPGEKIRMSPRKSKVDSTTSWNPTRASVHGLAPGASVHGLAPGTSKPEQTRRHNLPVNKSISGRNITSGILQIATGDRSRSSISSGSKAKPVTVSSPFRFRSEERAAKRREKLEERCNASEAESIYQEWKQRFEITNKQQSTNCEEGRCHESKSCTQTTRMSAVSPQPPKSGRKPSSSESGHAPPQRTLDSVAMPKCNRMLSYSVTSSPQQWKKGHENASPNIQN